MDISRRAFVGGLLASTAVARVPVGGGGLSLSGVPIVFDPPWREGTYTFIYGTDDAPMEFSGYELMYPPVV